MRFADLHTHTSLCGHASGAPEEYLRCAMERGLAWYGISDHFPAPGGYDEAFRMKPQDYPAYRDLVNSMREKAAQSGMQVLYGAEFDYVPGRMREVYELLDREDFDYTIGSVHYVDDFAFDDPDKLAEWSVRGADAVWNRYGELLQEFVSSCSFQIMAHADLPKKFGIRPRDLS